MSKIVRAVNTMISNIDKVGRVFENSQEYFFEYGNKYNWSIILNTDDDNIALYYYPDSETLEDLSDSNDWQQTRFIRYTTEDLKTREANESFKELYLLIKEKLYGIDKVLDDIITDDEIPF